MKICAVIAEYNPFHNGHLKQIEYIKERLPDTVIVSVMSGNVVQRGQLAVYDKYTRAEMALRCGVDAVLELPYPWCGASAGYFAKGGVEIAKAIGADYLCFGSESGDIEELKKVADRTVSAEYTDLLDSFIKNEPDAAYISLSRRAYRELYGEDIPDGANNTLAIEYLKHIGDITPVTYKRTFPSSATAARGFLRGEELDSFKATVPEKAYDVCKNTKVTNSERISALVLWILCNSSIEELCSYADIDAGVASRLISCANESVSLAELFEKCATKKYTNSRLRRAVLNIILATTKEHLEDAPAFTILLSANERGRAALKQIKKQGSIQIITKPADHESVREQFEHSSRADRLFAAARGESFSDIFKKKPFII